MRLRDPPAVAARTRRTYRLQALALRNAHGVQRVVQRQIEPLCVTYVCRSTNLSITQSNALDRARSRQQAAQLQRQRTRTFFWRASFHVL